MKPTKWHSQKVNGRDEILRDIEKRAGVYYESVVRDVRGVMHDYEVDMYRLVIAIGKHYGMDKAYEIMSETVTDKRLRWLDQALPELELTGTDVEKAMTLYIKYFKLKKEDYSILDQTKDRVVFRRKDFINAIAHACDMLGLDVVEVNNKVYASATNRMFKKINLNARHVVIRFENDWYDEKIEVIP